MNISGIRPTIDFYDFNNRVQLDSVKADVTALSQTPDSVESGSPKIDEESILNARKKQTFGSFEYANTYKPQETFEMKGADSDIHSLDVARAVSDMQKDSVIQQYQFFVKDVTVDKPDTVRAVENFAL